MYTPDPLLDNIRKIENPQDRAQLKTRFLQNNETLLIPKFLDNKKAMGRRLSAMLILSTSLGFVTAWFGATTFDHINMKIDNFRELYHP